MSCVRVGDPFQFLSNKDQMEKAGQCFYCKTPATFDSHYSAANPTIVMGVTEVKQAPSRVEALPMLESKPTPRLRGATSVMTTIDDAGFVDPVARNLLPSIRPNYVDGGGTVEVILKQRPSVADVRDIGESQPATGNGEIPKQSKFVVDDVDDVDFKED